LSPPLNNYAIIISIVIGRVVKMELCITTDRACILTGELSPKPYPGIDDAYIPVVIRLKEMP